MTPQRKLTKSVFLKETCTYFVNDELTPILSDKVFLHALQTAYHFPSDCLKSRKPNFITRGTVVIPASTPFDCSACAELSPESASSIYVQYQTQVTSFQ